MTLKPRSSSPRLQHNFLSMVYDNGLEQLVKEPTMEENTLDLFLTNCPQLEVVPGISDHSIPYCEISTSARRKKQTQRQIPLYSKADWDSLRTVAIERSADLQRMDGVATTEELWTTFRDSLLAVVKFIPHKTARPKPCQPWVTPSNRKLINRRDRTYRKMKKTGSEDLRTEVKNYAEATGTTSTPSLLERTHQTKQARTNDFGHILNIRAIRHRRCPPQEGWSPNL